MARRGRLFCDTEALELILEDGSDDEDAVVRMFSDDESDDEGVEECNTNTEDVITNTPLRQGRETENPPADDSDSDNDDETMVNDDIPPTTTTTSGASSTAEPFEIDPMFDDIELEDLDADYLSNWSKDLTDFPLVPPFTGNPGLNVDMSADSSPLAFFELFITHDIIKHIKSETNKYARRTIATKERENVQLSPRSMFRQWKTVTEDDIYRFLSVLMHISLVDKPFISDYFALHPVLNTPFAKRLMTRDRFKSILSFFHLNDNTTYIPRGEDGHDPLHKIRPFYDHLIHTFKSVYTPMENIAIDEALCPWRGRLNFKVYMKDKPTKWGVKFYVLCESNSGYAWNFEIMASVPGISNTPYDVVLRLIHPLLNQGYSLYIDNYYCNPALCDTLAANNTMVVGTVRANRVGLPKDLMATPLAVGNMDYMRRNQLLAIKWKDKREVQVLSTKHRPEMVAHTSRTETKLKPSAVVDYSKHMGGVDRSDQLISYTPLHRKTIKWWKKVAFHLLTLSLVQASILYNNYHKQRNQKGLRLSRFIMQVCLSLATQRATLGATLDQAPNAGPCQQLERLHGRHFLIPIQEGAKKYNACYVCYRKAVKANASRDYLKNRVQRTPYKCGQCDKKNLCVYPCFEAYHTKVDYLC